ncbi:hypothetical protein M5K25_004589 [Dendrobium thyrsiflorum]|uniref:RNase H type-1 domain-containing protein n=1 Tax=Dendrobium thyrsiflorum TaxID=117978 RepID=A0ABD0VMG3_DENTH
MWVLKLCNLAHTHSGDLVERKIKKSFFSHIVQDDLPIILDNVLQSWLKQTLDEDIRTWGNERSDRSSLSSTSAIGLREREGELGREEEACEGELVRVFTKVAPSKGSVRRLRSSSRIFKDLGGVYFSEKKGFSASFRWEQKELRFSAGFRWKRKEFGFSASPGFHSRWGMIESDEEVTTEVGELRLGIEVLVVPTGMVSSKLSGREVDVAEGAAGWYLLDLGKYGVWQRKLVDCSDCLRCCGCLEDVDHIFVKCNKIHSILKFLAGWGCNLPSFNDLSDCIKCIISLATSNPFIGNLYYTVVFLYWKSRNNLSHGGRDDSSMLSNVSWCPPPPRWIKANVDATISINNKAGIGVVFRDCKGRFLYAFGRSLLYRDIAQVEVLSILAVGDTIKDSMIQADRIIIESDNSNVIRFFIDIINNNLDKEANLCSLDSSRRAARFDYKHVPFGNRLELQMTLRVLKLSPEHRKTVPGTPKTSDLAFLGQKLDPGSPRQPNQPNRPAGRRTRQRRRRRQNGARGSLGPRPARARPTPGPRLARARLISGPVRPARARPVLGPADPCPTRARPAPGLAGPHLARAVSRRGLPLALYRRHPLFRPRAPLYKKEHFFVQEILRPIEICSLLMTEVGGNVADGGGRKNRCWKMKEIRIPVMDGNPTLERCSMTLTCMKEDGSNPPGIDLPLIERKMASSSKKSKVSKGSSRNENFLSKDNETAYGRYSASKITPSRILIQSDIDFQILPLFSSTQLSFILTLSHSYHKEMFLQFLSNLRVTPECTRLTSFVMQQKVIIDKEDLETFLHLRTEGDRLHTLIQESDISWSLVNDTLRGNKDKVHQPRVYTLLQNARIIQHVLRSSIIPKAGDRVNMTPLLSLVTHLIMSNNPFDEAQLILDYIHSLSNIRHPQIKRKKNIALGHLVCYILEKKYNLIYPEPPTEEPIFFTNASFRSLVHDPIIEGEDSEGKKEAPSEPAPVPNQNAFQDIIQRFDTMETNFGQRFDQIDLHMKTQEDRHNLDMAWIHGQTDYINQNVAMINSYFTAFNPQPPPDQDPGA